MTPMALFYFDRPVGHPSPKVIFKLDAKAMGPFFVQKVAKLYGQQVIIEDQDFLSGCIRQAWAHTIHASHLAPFDEPYIEP